jgi:hypothetical protein
LRILEYLGWIAEDSHSRRDISEDHGSGPDCRASTDMSSRDDACSRPQEDAFANLDEACDIAMRAGSGPSADDGIMPDSGTKV